MKTIQTVDAQTLIATIGAQAFQQLKRSGKMRIERKATHNSNTRIYWVTLPKNIQSQLAQQDHRRTSEQNQH